MAMMKDGSHDAIVRELRHQLYYTSPGRDREAVRQELEFWLRHPRRHPSR